MKYSEFNPKEKIIRANLKLQTAFEVLVTNEDSEWEVQTSLIRTRLSSYS